MGISLTRSLKDVDLLREVVVYERWSHMEARNTNAFDVLVSPRNLILEMNEISFTERRNRSSMRSKSTKARFIFQLFSILYSNTVCSSNSRTTSPIQLTAVANNRCEMQIRISSVKFSLHVYVI